MGACRVGIGAGKIVSTKSKGGYCDNDWMLVTWVTADGRTEVPPIRLLADPPGDFPHVLWDGTQFVANGSVQHVDDSLSVVATVTVVNLASEPANGQPALAAEFARKIYDFVVEKLVEYGESVWAAYGLKAFFDSIGELGGEKVQKALDDAAEWVRGAIDDAADWFYNTLMDLFDGPRENCDGVVLTDTFTFAPDTARNELLTRHYIGKQDNEDCGGPPRTDITWKLQRDAFSFQDYPPLGRQFVPGLVWTITPRPAIIEGIPGSNVPDLVWYNHHQNPAAPRAWDGGRTVGWNWTHPWMLPGQTGEIYTIDADGTLSWRKNRAVRDGRADWTELRAVGWGWADESIEAVMCEAMPDHDPTLYPRPRRDQETADFYVLRRDGGLDYYRHEGAKFGTQAWANGGTPLRLPGEWRDGNLMIISGGSGVLYVIKRNGSLRWFHHNGAGGITGGHQIGEGWAEFRDVFSTGDGNIYAVQPDGKLLWYRYSEWNTGAAGGWLGREFVGTGWHEVKILANRIRVF
jgi:hypothetical protein